MANNILLLGDLHLANWKAYGGPLVRGINRRCQELLDALERTVDDAIEKHDVKAVLQVGDFFDNSRPPAPVVDAALRLLTSYKGLEWHIMAGNHDVTSFGAPSALAPLDHVPGIHIYEQVGLADVAGWKVGMVPYVSHNALEAYQACNRAMLGERIDFYALHYGVVEVPNRPDLLQFSQVNGTGSLSMPGSPIWSVSGHEHGERGLFGKNVRLGSFSHLNWSAVHEPQTIPCAVVLLDHDVRWGYSKVPRFQDIRGRSEAQNLSLAVNMIETGLYLQGDKEQEQFLRELELGGLIQGWRLRPEDGEVLEGEDVPDALEEFSEHEETVTAALEEQDRDLMEESTQRVWEACVDHLNKSNA